jgi:hypothetical protein
MLTKGAEILRGPSALVELNPGGEAWNLQLAIVHKLGQEVANLKSEVRQPMSGPL